MAAKRALGLVSPERSALFLCDIQELFRPLIHKSETVITRSVFLYKISNLLDMPTVATEQYSKVFGHTVPDFNLSCPVYEKRQFSMLTEEVTAHLEGLNRDQIILCGIESHVCVLQTAMDLIASGKEVHLVCDAVSSQKAHDRAVALERMKAMGVYLTTSESIMFQLLRTSQHPQFKQCSNLLKEVNALPNEFAHDTVN